MKIEINGLRLTEETAQIGLKVEGDEIDLIQLVATCMETNEVFAGIIIDATTMFLENK